MLLRAPDYIDADRNSCHRAASRGRGQSRSGEENRRPAALQQPQSVVDASCYLNGSTCDAELALRYWAQIMSPCPRRGDWGSATGLTITGRTFMMVKPTIPRFGQRSPDEQGFKLRATFQK
jgi:hypothetical protein